MLEEVHGSLSYPVRYRYSDQNRKGDHICYISDLSYMRQKLPGREHHQGAGHHPRRNGGKLERVPKRKGVTPIIVGRV